MFERNVQSALTASLKSPSEVTVISNPMALSDIEEDSKGMDTSGHSSITLVHCLVENSIDIPPADLCSREDRGSTVTLDVERHEQLVDDFVTTKQLEIKITKSLSAKQHWKPPSKCEVLTTFLLFDTVCAAVITSRDKKNGMVFSSSSVSKSSPTIRVGLSRHAKVKSLHIPVKHSLKEK